MLGIILPSAICTYSIYKHISNTIDSALDTSLNLRRMIIYSFAMT